MSRSASRVVPTPVPTPVLALPLAIVLAIVLAFGTLVLAVGALAPRPAAAAPVTSGALDWGIRASFRSYIVGPIAQGTVTTDAPAATNADGTYRFPATAGGDATAGGAVDIGFGGTIRFRGHGYHDPAAGDLLQVSVGDVRLRGSGASGGTATLIADITSLPLPDDLAHPGPAGAAVTHADIELATVALGSVTPETTGSGFVLRNVPVTLTAAGAAAFAGFYVAGEPLDPLTLTVTTGSTGGGGSSTTATTTARPGGGAAVGVTVGGSGSGGSGSGGAGSGGAGSGAGGTGGLAYTGWSVGAAVAGLALLAGGIAFVATADAARRLRGALHPARVRAGSVSGGRGGGDDRRR